MTPEREHDVVLFGATGFTGGLTAEYLAQACAGTPTRWALAGRSRSKLDAVADRLGGAPALIVADVEDPRSMREMAESAKVVITTVGPYIIYGEPVVGACAAAGTDYVDLTGEPEFVDRMWLTHHEQARRTGARIVHSCGFDSLPYDLGALFTVAQLPADTPITLEGFVRAGGTFSGGTYHSTLHVMGRLVQARQVAAQRRRLESPPTGRRVRGMTTPPHHDEVAGGWVVPVPTIDPITVLRSARALDRYGPDFRYGHYFVFTSLPMMVAAGAGVGTFVAAAQLPPVRDLLGKLRDPGDGPSAEQRARGWFRVRFHGRAGEHEVTTQVSGGDPGYGETAKMLAESALCLAQDDLPQTAGQVTPAVAMSRPLIDRLVRAGIRFETIG